MAKISKKMSFADAMKENPKAGDAFMEAGLHCACCPMAQQESIEEGCAAHGIDADKLIEKLNKKKVKK